jgi:hypothetical protein
MDVKWRLFVPTPHPLNKPSDLLMMLMAAKTEGRQKLLKYRGLRAALQPSGVNLAQDGWLPAIAFASSTVRPSVLVRNRRFVSSRSGGCWP